MSHYRIAKHPILPIPDRNEIEFFFDGKALRAFEGETIAAALFANGIRVFGHHPKDGSPQGIYCANGQCSQCMVIADNLPMKSCMELIQSGMVITPANGLPILPKQESPLLTREIDNIKIPVLIIGGGPSGLSAAIELGKVGVQCILVDDKHRLGGKLVLQTHRFFGSSNAVYAGTRGIDIATLLENEVKTYPSIQTWIKSTALAVFSDKKVGIFKNGETYILIEPEVILVACGAREKFLTFKGNTLPGVFGAGAFQTLVNRDLVRPSESLFIVGGGNVGLIAGYHALQAGIRVEGLVEALPECGGYKVHKDKLVRMGVPIWTSHTILSANGFDSVESVTIAQVDSKFNPLLGTERTIPCDTVLIAVGLDPVNEFYLKAKDFEIPTFVAGDAEEIAEASAAIFSGKIKGREIASFLGVLTDEIPQSWYRTGEILKSKPGKTYIEDIPEASGGVTPVIHCNQEIPCNPCAALCPHGLIYIDDKDIRQIPTFLGNNYCCEACERCVVGCPGLAITLVDQRNNFENPLVSVPYEFIRETIQKNDNISVLDTEGKELGQFPVVDVHSIPQNDRTLVVQIQAPKEVAYLIAGIKIQEEMPKVMSEAVSEPLSDEMIVCRCERVTAREIRQVIKEGFRDINEIKAITRAGMGACGSKTCNSIIQRLFREEGIPIEDVTDQTRRPIFIEVQLGAFAGSELSGKEKE